MENGDGTSELNAQQKIKNPNRDQKAKPKAISYIAL